MIMKNKQCLNCKTYISARKDRCIVHSQEQFEKRQREGHKRFYEKKKAKPELADKLTDTVSEVVRSLRR